MTMLPRISLRLWAKTAHFNYADLVVKMVKNRLGTGFIRFSILILGLKRWFLTFTLKCR